MYNVTAIVPGGQGIGFALAGIEIREVASTDEAYRTLATELEDESNGVILIDEGLTLNLPPKLRAQVDDSVIPLVMEIPVINKWESMKLSESMVSDIIQRAVGYRIKFSGD